MKTVRIALVAAGVLAGSVCAAADPAWYVRKATWQQTLAASRDAMRKKPASLRGPARATSATRAGGGQAPLPDFGRDDFTVTGWIRTTQGGTIVAKAPAKGGWAEQGKSLFVEGGRLNYDIGWVGCVTSRRRVGDGKWHHVAMTKKGAVLRMFIDGAADQVGELAGERDVKGHVLKIGFTCPNFPEERSGFVGEIDELRIYARPLTSEQIKAHANTPPPQGTAGLAAYWPFDDGLADVAGGRHAAAVGPTAQTAGKVGQALKLTGRAHATVAGGGDEWGTLWSLLRRDFRDAESVRQMAWEQEDRIQRGAAAPGDWSSLARRYAAACSRAPAIAAEARKLAANVRSEAGLAKMRALYYRSRTYELAMAPIRRYKPNALRRAVEYLGRKFPDRYRAAAYLERLDAVEQAVAAAARQGGSSERVEGAIKDLVVLRREALVTGNPLLGFDRLLFVKRHTYTSSHFYTDFIDGCKHFGGNLCVLSMKDGRVTELIGSMKEGIFGRFDLSFDARRIVFDWKVSQEKGFRIYEAGITGKAVRQLTFEPPDEARRVKLYDNSFLGGTGRLGYNHHTDDMHPCYLPDGGVCFSSTRCEFGTLCDAPDILSTAVLYRMDADGGNMTKLTNSAVSEFSPSVMPDGRILYTRWEYVDKGQIGVKCLWAMRPDGTGTVEIFGNNHAFPPTMLHGRAIGGRSDRFVMLGTPHYPQSGIGTVIRVDINYDTLTRRPMTYITPDVDIRTEGGFHHRVGQRWVRHGNGPLYMDPYPLDEKFFLVAYNPDKRWNDPTAYGLYLLDEFGNHELIYRDAEISCWQPTPLRARPTPPALSSVLPPKPAGEPTATVIMSDVYAGLTGVRRGSIKYLRVMEQVPRPWGARRFWDLRGKHNRHTNLVSRGLNLGLKVLHGVVPVAADGSACFTVPADRSIYLQALDADYMEVQRMRTYVNFRPGEVRSCIGCHESRKTAPTYTSALALRRLPATPAAQPGEAAPRAIHYPADVQPILDRHCVKCHSGRQPKARLDLSGEMTTHFSRSYENILRRRLVRNFNEGSDWDGIPASLPKTVGSHASKLVAHLRKGHQKIKLSRPEWIKLTTWIDSSCQYYGSYFGRKNLAYKDHPDFRRTPTFAEAISPTAPTNRGSE